MAQTTALLEHQIEIPAGQNDPEPWLRRVPARWAVSLLADENGRPVQLLCLKDLRQGLRNRMAEPSAAVPSRRANWRELVRNISWQLVDSDFEADWIYLQAARERFPETYQETVARARAWFVHIDPDALFPRYTKTTDLAVSRGHLVGPLPDKHAAARLIELIEDAFDLCRYHHILTQSPRGRACAYKDMGKCPAPCDGSISIGQYRHMVDMSLGGVLHTASLIEQHTRRMEQAANELRFETAAKILAYIDQLGQLKQGAFRLVRPLAEFAFVSLQPGPRAGQAKVFLILGGLIVPAASLIGEKGEMPELITSMMTLSDDCRSSGQIAQAGGDQIGLVARHLFAPRKSSGAFIALSDLTEASLAAAYRRVCAAQKARSRHAAITGDAVLAPPGEIKP